MCSPSLSFVRSYLSCIDSTHCSVTIEGCPSFLHHQIITMVLKLQFLDDLGVSRHPEVFVFHLISVNEKAIRFRTQIIVQLHLQNGPELSSQGQMVCTEETQSVLIVKILKNYSKDEGEPSPSSAKMVWIVTAKALFTHLLTYLFLRFIAAF